MKKAFITFWRKIPWLCSLAGLDLMIPAHGAAQWSVQQGAKEHPALVVALALTSLVLFIIYLFQKRETLGKKISRQNHPCLNTLKNQKTDKLLSQLFEQEIFPMIKLCLEKGEILDATPPICQILGYTRDEILKKKPFDLGLLPEKKMKEKLITQGWYESDTSLPHKDSESWVNCRTLNILIPSKNQRTVMTIITQISEKPAAAFKNANGIGGESIAQYKF